MGERPFSGERVVVEREALSLVRQVVETPVFHRLTDLALDERLAHLLAGRFGWIWPFRIALPSHVASVAQVSDRQAVALRR